VGDRLLRAVEKWLLPWYDRQKAEAAERAAQVAAVRSEAIRRRSIAARIEAERVSKLYRERLVGNRS
jgi:hypothetical protein